ncbi:MAG TPA: NIPSNAP family protein [Candidatus Binatia bacterium]|jgi:hypothetical protein|nr:NIPSNAP family protein [Candidatus Binatia bacterium]
MKRREFLKTSLTVSTLAGLSSAPLGASAAQPSGGNREYYELRTYRLKAGTKSELLDAYLEKAAIPAWNRLGLKPVGVFSQQERTGAPKGTEVRDENAVFVLIPYPSLESFAGVTAALMADAEFHKAGAEYLQTPKTNPAFERIDSWLMLAFAGMPRIELPPYSREKKPRMFEIRTYESYSEVKAFKKVEMFNSGEIDTMREVGLAPVFYGQALIGPNLPHLTYMLSAEDQAAHDKHWGDFGKHPVWNKLKNDHQYDETVSKIVNRFLVPKSYSQI